jgi:PQQ-like domain
MQMPVARRTPGSLPCSGWMLPGTGRSCRQPASGRTVRILTVVAATLILTGAARSEETGYDPADDAKVLHDAGIGTDAAGLVAFLRAQTPAPSEQARLSARLIDLGSPAFQVRERASHELTEAGRFALPLLRSGLTSSDLEVARRSARCIEAIEQSPAATLVASAARLAAVTRPAGATEALLTILPRVEDETAEEAIFQALTAVAVTGGVAEAAVVQASGDRDALTRAAAGFVLGQASALQRGVAVHLLTDTDARVRYRTACGLLRGGERSAVPALIVLLEDGPASVAWRAQDLLDRLGGDMGVPTVAGADAAARHRLRVAWDDWWKTNADRIDLARASRREACLGLNLVVELDSADRGGPGRVWECGADGRSRWEITNLHRPIDARLLPSGRVLVAEHSPPRVTERERDGRVVWEYTPSGQPVSCERLPDGNTFIATYNELLEVNRDKGVVCSIKLPAMMVFYACKLRNGHYLYVSSNNRVVELDVSGKEISSVAVENSGGWASVERLVGGNLLVALYNAKKVVELDRTGRVLWQCDVEFPGHATRLTNGNTLVASIEGRRIVEFDRAGKEVWHQSTSGRPFHAYRR